MGSSTLTGGKWTTYRKMAEDVIDQAETLAGLDHRRCQTEDMQIHGWTRKSIPEKNLQPYGADALQIRELLAEQPELSETIHPDLPVQKVEVAWHAREEMARTVEDVLSRRTRCLLLNAQASIEAAGVVAEVLAGELGRDDAWQQAQVAAYTELAKGYVFKDAASSAKRA